MRKSKEQSIVKFLDILSSAAGKNYVSGELLARKTGISRAAVWKQVRQLRQFGYGIDSARGAGYRLGRPTQFPVPWELRKILHTSLIGKELLYKNLVDSTQNAALVIAAKRPESNGLVVIAEQQKSGRGRLNRKWLSPPGGLWLSVLVRPKIPANGITILPFLAALAVRDAIARLTGIEAKLKWPNDVLISDKKVAGILLDVSAEADRLNYAVIGIGINANTDLSAIRSKIAKGQEVTSLKEEAGEAVNRLRLTAFILEELESYLNRLLESGPGPVISAWKKRTEMFGKKVTVIQDSKVVQEGTAVDINEDGSLVLRLGTGATSLVVSGDIRIRL